MNVMITGASGGLGRALANECGRRGYNLFLTDINGDGLLCIKRGLERQFNVAVATAACDLTNPESVDKMLDIINKYEIRFDMLLNVAGLDFEGGFMGREREKLVKIVMLNNAATLRITTPSCAAGRAGPPLCSYQVLHQCFYADKGDLRRVKTLSADLPLHCARSLKMRMLTY